MLSLIGTGAELLLIGHTEDFWQLAPLVIMGLSVLAFGWHILIRSRASIRAIQIIMLLLIISGGVGMFLHHRAKEEFKLELQPDLKGAKLFWEALLGSTPPSLAPGAMIQCGLLGLAYTFRHPSLNQIAVKTETSNKETP